MHFYLQFTSVLSTYVLYACVCSDQQFSHETILLLLVFLMVFFALQIRRTLQYTKGRHKLKT